MGGCCCDFDFVGVLFGVCKICNFLGGGWVGGWVDGWMDGWMARRQHSTWLGPRSSRTRNVPAHQSSPVTWGCWARIRPLGSQKKKISKIKNLEFVEIADLLKEA